MFPHGYFPAGGFAPTYFPPVGEVVAPVETDDRLEDGIWDAIELGGSWAEPVESGGWAGEVNDGRWDDEE